MIFGDRQALHCKWSLVARDWRCEVDMTIPGIRTSFVRVSAWSTRTKRLYISRYRVQGPMYLTVKSRNWSIFKPLLTMIWIDGIS